MSHTPGKLELWTSNSFRRFGVRGGAPICEPIKQNDGHPDLYFRNGGFNGPDARRMLACWNACDGISTEALEQHVADPGVSYVFHAANAHEGLVTALREYVESSQTVIDMLRGLVAGDSAPDELTVSRLGKRADDAMKRAYEQLAKYPKVPA